MGPVLSAPGELDKELDSSDGKNDLEAQSPDIHTSKKCWDGSEDSLPQTRQRRRVAQLEAVLHSAPPFQRSPSGSERRDQSELLRTEELEKKKRIKPKFTRFDDELSLVS
ncbi:hypothetical protein MHYP_G00053750 [Metynnis hypsauchen]